MFLFPCHHVSTRSHFEIAIVCKIAPLKVSQWFLIFLPFKNVIFFFQYIFFLTSPPHKGVEIYISCERIFLFLEMDNFLNVAPKRAQRGNVFWDVESFLYHVNVYSFFFGKWTIFLTSAIGARSSENGDYISLIFSMFFPMLRPKPFV